MHQHPLVIVQALPMMIAVNGEGAQENVTILFITLCLSASSGVTSTGAQEFSVERHQGTVDFLFVNRYFVELFAI